MKDFLLITILAATASLAVGQSVTVGKAGSGATYAGLNQAIVAVGE